VGPEESWATGPPKVMKNALCPAIALHGSLALPFVIPSVPGFPTSQLSPAPLMWFSLKRTTWALIEAAILDRKSGEAEGSAVPRTPPGNVFDQSVAEWRDLGVPLNDSLPLAWATGKTLIYPTWKQSLPGWLLTSTRHAANLRRTRDMSSEARDHQSDPD
jgi:hypothetical protein